MTHGRDCPRRCSQCAGITPKRITHDGERLLIDGQPTERTIDGEHSDVHRRYQRGPRITARPKQ